MSKDAFPPLWYPLRIRNSSLSRLNLMKERLDAQDDVMETYVPLAFIRVNKEKMGFAPRLVNYIFVRAAFDKLVKLKSNHEWFEPLRFVMHPTYDEKYDRHDEVLTISDKMMDDYIRVTKEENDKVIMLDNIKFACKPSREVQIIEGEFTGVIGRVKRIKGYRCVVLPIGNEIAAAVLDVPNSHLRYLTDEEARQLKG